MQQRAVITCLSLAKEVYLQHARFVSGMQMCGCLSQVDPATFRLVGTVLEKHLFSRYNCRTPEQFLKFC